MNKFITFAFLTMLITGNALAQTRHAFYNDVQIIKNYDNMFAPPEHPIVFVGSSSVRKWGSLQHVFGAYDVINRGIGGAVIEDILYFLPDLVFNYKPRQIVLYVGENNLVVETETADTILNQTITLFKAIRAQLPDIPIVYISMKPSPSRDKFQQKCVAANLLIKNYLAADPHTVFVDIFTPMLDHGHLRRELFQDDMLHMKPNGYAIWEQAITPYLLK